MNEIAASNLLGTLMEYAVQNPVCDERTSEMILLES